MCSSPYFLGKIKSGVTLFIGLPSKINTPTIKAKERMRKMRDIAVIGGGAAGLVAAITAARAGSKVTIFERQSRVGKKILVTGNGRCNITNINMKPKHFHTSSKKDCFLPIVRKDVETTLEFFRTLGIERLVENTKVYPASEQASSVLDVLRMEIERLNVEVLVDTKVIKLKRQEDKWQVVTEGEASYHFDRVIVTTGGLAAPQLGCDETGYSILKALGHHHVPNLPTLVHIVSSTKYCKMMQGMRFKSEVSILVEDKLIRKERGEVLFTEDGLSGPPIFQLSRIAAESFARNKKCEIHMDFMPDQTKEDIVATIYERIGQGSNKTIEELFVGWINKKAIMAIIKEAKVGSPVAPCENLEYEMIEALAETIKNLVFEVKGTRGFKFAQATVGGITLDEVNLETMESLKAPGLYLAGEVLDVDGDCGGYNLQWAWSTGMVAGEEAVK